MGALSHYFVASDIKSLKNPDKRKADRLYKERMKPPGRSSKYTGKGTPANTPVTPKPGANQQPIMALDTALGG